MAIRILHIFGAMNPGGAEKRTLDVMRNISANDFHFDFCTLLSKQPGLLEPEIQGLGGNVYPCNLFNWKFPKQFCELLVQGKYDIVHSHVQLFSGYLLRLAHKMGIPGRIAHLRSMSDGKLSTPRRIIQRWLMKHWIRTYATHIVAVGQYTMSAAWNPNWQSDPKCQVIYNAVDTKPLNVPCDRAGIRQEFGFADDSIIITHVGNFLPPKNHLRMLQIFRELQTILPQARLLMVGNHHTPIGEQVRAWIAEHHIQNLVCLSGIRHDIGRILRSSDVMLFPSKWEGISGVLLEAFAVGLPIVASNIPCNQEIQQYNSRMQVIGLQEKNMVWANALAQWTKVGPSSDTEMFQQSPFTIEKNIAAMQQLWLHAAHRTS